MLLGSGATIRRHLIIISLYLWLLSILIVTSASSSSCDNIISGTTRRMLPSFIRHNSRHAALFTSVLGGAAGASQMSAAATSSETSVINGVNLQKITSEEGPLGPTIKAGALFSPNGAIIFVVRRPGCQLCREEALDLTTQLMPSLTSSKKPRLVAVVTETTSVGGFLDCFKGGETYLDQGEEFKKYLGNRWLGIYGLFYPSVWKNGKRSSEKYPELKGDLKGEGRRLGGLLVVDKEGQVKFEHKEEVFGDHAALDDIRKAIETL